MKKNVMMRLACFLLVAVLISTSAISGTYAKYVTANTATDSARVAKWGVEIQAYNEMFANSYKNTKTTWTDNEKLAEITVQADTKEEKVIAPGTNGQLAAFGVTGTPEVDVQVTYVADLQLTNWTVNNSEYCPIVFKVNGQEFKISNESGSTITTIAALEKAVEDAIVDCDAYYHTNTDLSAVNDDLTVTWEWPFYTSDENDVKDTALGDAAKDNPATISLKVTVAVTQVN